jgi:PAS domain S-box-containing protein
MNFRLRGGERAVLITLLYAVIGLLWIYFSDKITFWWIDSPDVIYWLQLLKGSFYVITTAIILYFLINRQLLRVGRYVDLLNSNNKLINFILRNNHGVIVLVIERDGKILYALGDDSLVEGLSISELQGESISRWLKKESELMDFNIVLYNTFLNNSYSSDVEIMGKWFRVKGDLFTENELTGTVACIQLTNVTSHHELLELNVLLKEENKKCMVELQSVRSKLNRELDKKSLIFNGLFEPVLIHELDSSGRLGKMHDANLAASAMFNCQKSDLLKYDIFSFLSFVSSRPSVGLQDNNFLKSTSIIAEADLKPLKSLVTKSVEIRSHLVGTLNHKYVLTVIRDLTDHFSEVTTLKNANSYFHHLLEHLSEGLLVVDRNMECKLSNQAVYQIVGLARKDAMSDVIAQIRNKGIDLIPLVNIAFAGQEMVIPDKKIKVNDRWVSIRIIPFRTDNGEIENVVCIISDISDRRLLENDVYELTQRVESGNKLISVFLSNLSHEIRTPMNGIVGFVELMEMEDLNSVQYNYMNLIKQSSQHLLSLVEAIFEISRLQDKQEVLNNNWFLPADILNELFEYTKSLLVSQGKKTVRLEKNADEYSKGVMIYSDREKLLSALKHICDNSVKFTHQGTITISLFLYENDAVKFVVSDTGIGFDSKHVRSIFLPFITFDFNKEHIYDGLGLGLAICLSKIELLGGTIEVESQINNGANFFVNVPIKNSAVVIPSSTDKNIGTWERVKKVMVVQSSYEGEDIYEQIFRPYAIKVIQSYDGMSAIETFYEQQDIDLVICDIRLSDMEAYEVYKAIKRMKSSTIIIAQTSYFLNDERHKCMDLGFAEYLVKPINASMIFGILVDLSVSTK